MQFLAVAKGSVGEQEAQLYVAFDQAYITEQEFVAIRKIAVSAKRLIGGPISYLRQSGMKGVKYK